MTLTIHVTADDIANGQRGACSCCPVAMGFCRALGHRNVMVAPKPGSIGRGKPVYQLYARSTHAEYDEGDWRDLPDHVSQRIIRFDDEGLMEPFSFDWSVTR